MKTRFEHDNGDLKCNFRSQDSEYFWVQYWIVLSVQKPGPNSSATATTCISTKLRTGFQAYCFDLHLDFIHYTNYTTHLSVSLIGLPYAF